MKPAMIGYEKNWMTKPGTGFSVLAVTFRYLPRCITPSRKMMIPDRNVIKMEASGPIRVTCGCNIRERIDVGPMFRSLQPPKMA